MRLLQPFWICEDKGAFTLDVRDFSVEFINTILVI